MSEKVTTEDGKLLLCQIIVNFTLDDMGAVEIHGGTVHEDPDNELPPEQVVFLLRNFLQEWEREQARPAMHELAGQMLAQGQPE